MHYKTIIATWDCLRARKKAYAHLSTQATTGIIGLAESITSIGGFVGGSGDGGGIRNFKQIFYFDFALYALRNGLVRLEDVTLVPTGEAA